MALVPTSQAGRSLPAAATRLPTSVPSQLTLEWEDLYETALGSLEKKIGTELSQDEYDSLVHGIDKTDSVSEEDARQMLERTRDSVQDRSRFVKFFECMDKLFDPLRFLKQGLDTLCQVDSVFCLVWGSLKILIEITTRIARIPAIITKGIESLLHHLPTYSLYSKCLAIRLPDGSKPLEGPLTAVYVEYLTFCILCGRVLKAGVLATLRQVGHDDSPFKKCLEAIHRTTKQIHDIASALSLVKNEVTSDKVDLILAILKGNTMSFSSSQTISGAYHLVPGLLSPCFVGREQELCWLKTFLAPENESISKARAGIYGLTGVGKTHLMLKYESENRRSYTSQLFLSASSRARFLESIRDVLETLGLRQDHATPATGVQQLRNWLSQNNSWLLLIDSVVSSTVDLVLNLLTADAEGHVIVTSQIRSAIEQIAVLPDAVLELCELELDHGMQLFSLAASIAAEESRRQVFKDVVTAMGLMPHAIEQAASYIRVNDLEPSEFLARYEAAPDQILDWDDGLEDDPVGELQERARRSSISKHLGVILDSLEGSHPDALVVLKFYSFMPELIPLFDEWYRHQKTFGLSPTKESLQAPAVSSWIAAPLSCLSFLAGCFGKASKRDAIGLEQMPLPAKEHPSHHLSRIFKDRDRRERAIAKLCDLSLTRRRTGEKALWMHDLTRKTVRKRIPDEDIEKWIFAGMDIVYHMMPDSDNKAEERAWIEKCLPALTTFIAEARSREIDPHQYACLLALCALVNLNYRSSLLSRDQFKEAWPLYQRSLGPRHPRAITVLHKMALAYRQIGDMVTCESLCKQAWKLFEQTLGPNEPQTLEALNDLASTIERAGRLKEAEDMLKKLYDLEGGASGLHRPETMAAAHNFALCLHNQGRLREAEVIYKEVLMASEQHLGIHDPRTLKTLNNYAATLDHDGRYNEANVIHDRAVVPCMKVMGVDHLLTLRMRGNMAGTLRQSGQFEQADEIMVLCYRTTENLFGCENFETITNLYERGEILQARGDILGARDAFAEAMSLLSNDMLQHPVVFRFIDSWGTAERQLGHLDVSREKSMDAYRLFENLLGWEDPYTLMAANDYAELLHAEGQWQEAWHLLTRCRDSFEGLLGVGHPHYAMVINNMGRLCWILNPEGALPLFKKARAILEQRVGQSHYCTLTVSLNLARTMFSQGDSQEAVSMVRETKKALEGGVGTEHPLVWACDTILGMMFASQRDDVSLENAGECFLAAMEAAAAVDYGKASSDYLLNICLLVLVLRQQQCDLSVISPLLAILETPQAMQVWPWTIPGRGALSAKQLSTAGIEIFSAGGYIPLAIGETTRLRWGRKTCWRESESPRLEE